MRPCIYRRTSTDKQARGNGAASQVDAVARWLRGEGIDPESVPVFDDEGESGRKVSRPAWDAMLARVRAGEFDAVVFYSLTRAARNVRALLAFTEEMKGRKVRIVFVKESLDLETHIGRFFLVVLAALAELEADVTAERVRDGIRAYVASGRPWGFARHARIPRGDWPAIAQRIAKGEKPAQIAAGYRVGVSAIRMGLCRMRKAVR